jgi:multiple sugar transport system permease protein/raffinose/stachyose/melibiose transport system permease protein
LAAITLVLLGPFIWTLMMSFRLTNEINSNPYGLPIPFRTHNYLYALLPPKEDLLALAGGFGVQSEAVEGWLAGIGLPDGGFGFGRYILNSVLVVVPALAIVTAVTTMAAYTFGRPRFAFRGREVVFLFIFISMLFPPQITLLSLFQLTIFYNVYNTPWALILVYPSMAIAFTTYILRAFFAQIPTEIEEAARIDGCNDWQLFAWVMLPIARPAVATTLIFNFLSFWNEFLYALTLVTKPDLHTIPLASWRWVGEYYLDIGGLAAGLVISMLPIVVLYMLLSEQFMRGMSAGAVKG